VDAFWAAILVPHVLASEEFPPDEAAALVLEFAVPFPALMVPLVIGHSSVRRVAEVAMTALRLAPESPRALAFAAQVAAVQGDHARASDLMDAAWSAGDGNDALRQVRVVVMVSSGRILAALPQIDALYAEQPDRFGPQALRAEALTLLERRASGPAGTACACGSSLPYADCCQAGDLEALRRFGDRTDLDALSAMLLAHLDGFTSHAADEWEQASGRRWRDVSSPTASELVLRRLWAADRRAGGNVLESFAALPEVRRSHGDLVDAWVGSARMGMWQVDPDQRGPGVMLVDLLSNVKIYAAVDPVLQNDGVFPWSVLVGWTVPVGGIWRSLPGHVVLSPAEADRMLGRVHDVVGVTRKREPDVPSEPPAEAIPPRMLTDPGPPHPPHVVPLMLAAATGMLPELLAEARAHRPSRATGNDEVASVRARIDADDLGALWSGLLDRGDIHCQSCDELSWSVDQGLESCNEGGESIGARVRLDDGCLTASAGSRDHLDDILAVMRHIEPSTLVAREAVSRAGAPPAPWASPAGVSSSAVARWVQRWPDEAAFELHCSTPREAADDIKTHPLLELLLRELEFHAAGVRREGRPAPDMAAVRERLGMALPPTLLTVAAAA
jgi:hypothetical protein